MAGNQTQIRAGKAFVELGTKDDKLREGLKKAKERLEKWGESIRGVGERLAGLGAAGIASLGGLSVHFADAAVDANNLSIRTGVALEEIQALAGAAGGVEVLEHAFDKIAEKIDEARQGGGEAANAFARLHLSVGQLLKLRPDEQFKLVAEQLANLKDKAAQTNLVKQIFGRGGAELIPLLTKGAKGIEELEKRFKAHHTIFTQADVATAKAFKLTMSDLTGDLERVGLAIGKAVLPYLEMWVTKLVPVIDSAVKWIDTNQELIVNVAEWAGAAVAGGIALIGLGYAFSYLAMRVGVAYQILSFALGSWMLLPALAVGGIAAVLYFAGAFDASMGDVKESWGGVVDAIRAGDLELAWKVVIAGGKAIWLDFRNWLADTWDAMVLVAFNAGNEIERSWNDTITNLKIGWEGLQEAIGLASKAAADQEYKRLDDELRANDANADAKIDALTKVQGAAKDARQKELDDVQGELHGLTQKAAKEAAAAKAPKEMPAFTLPGLPQPAGMHGESVGSFSAAAAGGLGLGTSTTGYLQSTAQATQATATNTAAIAAVIGSVFAVA
jgi:hypothetical protein